MMAIDEEIGTTAHKNEVGTEDNDVTSANDDVKRSKAHKNKFDPPKRKATKNEERRMIGKSVELLIISCMKNHVYKFGNKIRKQSEGGPIGLGLTGEIADCYMIKWDKKFLQKCKDLGINLTLYSRFKDDVFLSASSLKKGTKLVDGKLIVDLQKKEEDKDKMDDDVTMDIIRQVSE